MKYAEYIVFAFSRYKLPIYIFIFAILYYNHNLFLWLFGCLIAYEVLNIILILYVKNQDLKNNSISEKRKFVETTILNEKEKFKQQKFNEKKRG